uniref:Uncharacterized protein n=1 Tax=Caenorhabditis tropicalis TaxID=1561998 RepID=A0A1I7TWG6_9PELO
MFRILFTPISGTLVRSLSSFIAATFLSVSSANTLTRWPRSAHTFVTAELSIYNVFIVLPSLQGIRYVDFFDSSDEESVGRVDSPVCTRSMGNLESTLSNNNREYESVQSSPAVVTERETEMEDNQAEEIKITDESVSYSTQQNLEGAQKNKKLENENIQSPTVKSENETEMEDDQSELIKITDESVSYSTQGNLDGAENNKNLANDGQLPIAVTENETKTEDNQPEPIEIVDKSVSFSTQGNLDGAQKNNNLANDGQLPTAVTKYDTEGENKQSESTKMAEESGSSSTQEKMDGVTSDNKNLKNKSGQLPTIVIENADVEDNQPEPIKMVDKWTNI